MVEGALWINCFEGVCIYFIHSYIFCLLTSIPNDYGECLCVHPKSDVVEVDVWEDGCNPIYFRPGPATGLA